jgi:hypothetical protein
VISLRGVLVTASEGFACHRVYREYTVAFKVRAINTVHSNVTSEVWGSSGSFIWAHALLSVGEFSHEGSVFSSSFYVS